MTNKTHFAPLDDIESEDLAVAALSLSGNTESSDIDLALYDRLGVSMEQFAAVAGALLPLTITGRTAVCDERCHGFVDGQCFIVKRRADNGGEQ